MAAHTSAADLTEAAGTSENMFGGAGSKLYNAKLRGSSAHGKRSRPMTAKVKNN